MSRVDNFLLFSPASDSLPPLPWTAELDPRARGVAKIARWVRLDLDLHGDGACGEVYVWGLVTKERDANAVIDAFMAHDFGAPGAVLVVKRGEREQTELYYRDAPAPALPGGGS